MKVGHGQVPHSYSRGDGCAACVDDVLVGNVCKVEGGGREGLGQSNRESERIAVLDVRRNEGGGGRWGKGGRDRWGGWRWVGRGEIRGTGGEVGGRGGGY